MDSKIPFLEFKSSEENSKNFLRKSENPPARLMESSMRLMEFFNHRLPRIKNPQNRIFPSNFPQTSLRLPDEFQLPHPRFQKSDDGIQNFFRGRQEFQPISRISHPCARWNLWIPDFLSSSSPGIPTFLGRIPKFLSNRRLEFEFLRLAFLKTN